MKNVSTHLCRLLLAFVLIILANPFLEAGSGPVKTKKVTISVIDRATGKPVENAMVWFGTVKSDNINTISDSCKTNSGGKCKFTIETGEGYGYSMIAKKEGWFPCYSNDPKSPFVSARNFVSTPDNKIPLYLDSDPAVLLAFYKSVIPQIPVDSLVRMLLDDRYFTQNRSVLPSLEWKDIPKLLEIGNSAKLITHIPQNPVSSFIQEDCYLGIFALWLIESVRITESNPYLPPVMRFPSQNPILRNKPADDESFRTPNTPGMMLEAFTAYQSWWNKVKTLNPKEACRIDPLANTGLSW
jgi:hypothetical protein